MAPVSPSRGGPDGLILPESEAHHARDVLRLKRGDKVTVFNGLGREVRAEIIEIDGDQVRLRTLQETRTPPLPCRIVLAQAIPKGKNMDLIVQKAVEIGAAEIFPLISERTIVDLDKKEAAQKQSKWRQIAIEAAKQCGQNWLPEVHLPRKLKAFFDDVATGLRPVSPVAAVYDRRTNKSKSAGNDAAELRLIGSLQPDARHFKKVLSEYISEHKTRPTDVLMLIGPEGDFTPAELSLAKTHGCLPITLGPIILRVETAAIYCLSILSYELL